MYIPNSATEKQLLIQLKNGDISSFKDIYVYYKPLLFSFSLRYLKNKEDSEEIVQEIFVQFWENRHKIDTSLSIKSYLFTITKNKIIDYFRKHKVEALYENYVLNFIDLIHDNTQKDIIFKDLNTAVSEAIDKLSDKRKQVLIMSKKLGMTRAEIAKFLDISENTVKNQLQEALQFLKEAVGYEFIFLFITFLLFI